MYNNFIKGELIMHPQPLFTIFGRDVNLYGICIAVGILACITLLYIFTKKKGVPEEVQDYIFFIGILAIAFGLLASKFYQAVYDWIENDFKNFDFYGAGLTAMGGIIGGAALFIILYFALDNLVFRGKKKGYAKKYFNDVLLIAPICITVAHGFGRLGCLSAGCCHGAYLGRNYVFGGIWMSTNKGTGYFVPTQLYEALFLFALCAVLSVLYFKRCNILMSIYLIAYAVWRIFIEFFRDDARGAFVLGLSPSQWQSLVFILLGVGILLFYRWKKIPYKLPKE